MKLFKKAHYNRALGIEETDTPTDLTAEQLRALEEVAVKSAENMGAAQDLWHPGYGWLLKDGKITAEGIKFFEKHHPGS